MGKCIQCKITVEDNTIVCPLCNSVLDIEGEGDKTSMYPDVRVRTRLFQIISRAYLIIAILAESVLVIINILTFSGLWWSVICGGALAYLFVILNVFIDNYHYGHVMKIAIQTVTVIAFVILVDYIIGYTGWSIDYVMPSIIILVDVAIVILMFVNSTNWQNYIGLQITMIFLSLIGILLDYLSIVDWPILTYSAVLASVILFVLTILVGDKKAWNELKRKFHI